MIREDRLVNLFLNLIQIDAPAKQEANVVAWTRQYLESIGLQVREDDAGARIGGNANNLIATLPANVEGAPHVFLSAHFDTVEPTSGLVVEELDGVFRSASDTILGADDKGGMAPAIEAVHSLIESGAPHGQVTLLLSVAEEIGLLGADVVKLEDLNLDFGFVLDTGPPVGSFVNRAATHDKLDVIIHGKPAHAGKDPEKGINAIVVAATAIANMRIGRIGPETTANVGRIEGGTATNVVPAEVRLYCEARSTDVDALDAQVGHMVQCFEAAATQFGATVDIDHVRHYSGYEVPEDAPVAQVARRASEALGLNPFFRTTLGGSDANVYNAKGLPTVVVATGMDKIHTHEELISRQDLIDTAKLAYQLLLESANL
jgi:tripeptide aminopeptidase